MSKYQSALLKITSDAVIRAARGLIRDFSELERLQISKKGLADFVTSADIRVEKILKEELSKTRPDFGFITEEAGIDEGYDPNHIWIIDPIDGTTNFMHGIPHFCISVALQYKGEIIAGMVFDPIKNEEFWAEKGQGAYLNGDRIRVSARNELTNAVIGCGFPFAGTKNHDVRIKELIKMMPRAAGIRRMGSAALDLAYVAAGRFEGYWEDGLQAWDIAAGMLLVTEAGGKVTEIENAGGNMLKSGSILASNNVMHTTIADLLGQARRM